MSDFDDFVRAHSRTLIRTAYLVLRDASEAEDLVQECMLKLARRWSRVRALACLSPTQRATLVLRYYDDLSEAQTAQVLGVALGTVKSATSRGLLRLKQALAQPYNADHQAPEVGVDNEASD
jgi:DNA-directed RNA polymerase specialized sigma24 family protein